MATQLLRLTVLECDGAVEVGEEDELRITLSTFISEKPDGQLHTLGFVFMAGRSARLFCALILLEAFEGTVSEEGQAVTVG